MTKKRIIVNTIVLIILIYPCLWLANHTHRFLLGDKDLVFDIGFLIKGTTEKNVAIFFFVYVSVVILLIAWSWIQSLSLNYRSEEIQILPNLKIPAPAGQNQYGSAWWSEKKSLQRIFEKIKIKKNNNIVQWLVSNGDYDLDDDYNAENDTIHDCALLDSGGLVVGYSKNMRETYVETDDFHTLTIGATRSSKSRSVVLPSICVTALAGESMIVPDAKGELFCYTAPFLRRLGYEVITIDFEEPKRSNRYNYMQLIVDYIKAGDITAAKSETTELVEGIVGKTPTHGEPLWTEGNKSIMAACIMAVAYDNQKHPEYQNLSNVFNFIAKMCTPQGKGDRIPLEEYLNEKPDSHPAKSLASISDVAYIRTKSSFYSSALVALRLFEDYNIADMTSKTDFDIYTTGIKKRAIFIILPDEKDAFYPVASLFFYQHYQTCVMIAKRNGGRLPRRVEFFLDEIGNFTNIPRFNTMITVGAGRGIRFHLFLQENAQLDETYGNNISAIIRSNCETWLYLKSGNENMREEVSKRLGSYTTKSPNISASIQGYNGSVSYGYVGRPLLTADELNSIERPYQLVMQGGCKAIMYAPDLSKTIFNDMLGLGDKKHNIKVMIIRRQRRAERFISQPKLWTGWEKYREIELSQMPSFPENDNLEQPFIFA